MNESILILIIKKALITPIMLPTIIVIIQETIIFISALIIIQDTSIELREITAPMDKSNTPAASGIINPSETIIRTAS